MRQHIGLPLPRWLRRVRTEPPLWELPRADRVEWVLNPKTGRKVLCPVGGGVGIDGGGVLLNRTSEDDIPLDVREYVHSNLFPNAAPVVRFLVLWYKRPTDKHSRVYVIKNDGEKHLASITRHTLVRRKILDDTRGIATAHFLTTAMRELKHHWCTHLNLNFLWDDKKAVGHLLRGTHYLQYQPTWFSEDPAHVRSLLDAVAAQQLAYTLIPDWIEGLREMMSWYPVEHVSQLQAGRTPDEQEEIFQLCRLLLPELLMSNTS